VIGKAARPRSFPKSFQPERDLDVSYVHNMTAWVTAAEFSRWIKGVNSEMKRYACQAVVVLASVQTLPGRLVLSACKFADPEHVLSEL
jgi:hypothetical protein